MGCKTRVSVYEKANPCAAVEVPYYYAGQPMGTRLVLIGGCFDHELRIGNRVYSWSWCGDHPRKDEIKEVEEELFGLLKDECEYDEDASREYHSTCSSTYYDEYRCPREVARRLRKLARKLEQVSNT